ncbi:MAG TPA: L-serine ammonia-lyase [Haliscomenobacter sp.]|uniref:L-serine ammonia-lyase n=1 Tax=Haliscomenobacter sp. TaxID=2717303 RepID=UPI002BB76F7C|nr:L-serine ammonia-lyase [Haliscomenobacter sp.]HOY20126.1 L-serine ammonia-lyase [Haliscomenobacter sp.]
MEFISVFDMLKIGVGPSSSHTLGPWRAAERFVQELTAQTLLEKTNKLEVLLYGSLALTGKGHGTDIAILMGLSGKDPVTVPVAEVKTLPEQILQRKTLHLAGTHPIHFDPEADIHFRGYEMLPFHANGMKLSAINARGETIHHSTYYSIGGGFVVKEGEEHVALGHDSSVPFVVGSGEDLLQWCKQTKRKISDIVYENEKTFLSKAEIDERLMHIWSVMLDAVYRGCHTEGILPGGLDVARRAFNMNQKLLADAEYASAQEWVQCIRFSRIGFSEVIKWIGCFAMAVNEENANFGRIVTAPTNGAAGVIPAVLMYYLSFAKPLAKNEDIVRFLLVAGQVGALFKQGSTISAAMGGCQAEIGVSSAMAAAALAECLGATPGQALMAAEIAMEHHLGLTCDPVGGLVQVPCIERNSMGAVKAIMAAKIALEGDPAKAKVTLDAVIKTMWETSQDMNHKYKETSLGGLAVNIAIALPEC